MKNTLTFLFSTLLIFISFQLNSQCEPFISGYINLGQLNGHNYYLSTTDAKPTDAQSIAESLGGYLAVINNAEEDDFLLSFIDELTYIGLTDADTEGTLEWLNGDPANYTNIDPCGFCQENTDDMDFVVKEPWGIGNWSFSNFWNARKYIVEIPCGTSGTDCTFENEWVSNNYSFSSIAKKVTETSNGYELRYETFGNGSRVLIKWNIDTYGNTSSINEIEIPYPSGLDQGRYSCIGDYFFMHEVSGFDPVLYKIDFAGNTVWSKTYDINTTITNISYGVSREAWEDEDGILITGHVGETNGISQPYLIKTDLDGNEMWQQLLPNENGLLALSVISRSGDGGYYLNLWTGGQDPEKLIKIDADGNVIWTYETSISVGEVERTFIESPDGASVFYTQYTQFAGPTILVVKLNAGTGMMEWEKNIPELFSQTDPNTEYFYRSFVPTQDNGMMIQYYWQTGTTSGLFGQKYGKIDGNGNLAWGYDMPLARSEYSEPVALTTDGGFLFSGTNSNDRKTIWKFTSEGWNAPVCSGGGLQVNCEPNYFPADLMVTQSDPSGLTVSWDLPTATTDCPDGGILIEQVGGASSGDFFQPWVDYFAVYKITDACGNEEMCFYEFDVDGIYGGVICPADITVDATSADGAVVEFDLPIITPSSCIPGGLQLLSGQPSGSLFPVGVSEVQYGSFFGGSNAFCQNMQTCVLTITVNPPDNNGGGCPDDIAGFTAIGEYEGSKYYISNDVSRPTDAQDIAESYGGYLAVISSQEENDFIQQGANELTYIGLNDFDSEGNLGWVNGESLDYNNINPCGFCNENSDEMDFVVMQPWDGAWSFSNFWNQRKYVMEIPCNGSSGGGDCAFITTVGGNYTDVEIVETIDGYQVQAINSSFDIDYQEINLDKNGVVTSIDDIAIDMQNSSTYMQSENFYVSYAMLNGLSFDLKAYEADGSLKWEFSYDVDVIDIDADGLIGIRLVDVGDGIMVLGTYHFGNGPTWRRFVMKLNYEGFEIYQNQLDVLSDPSFMFDAQAASDNGLYFIRRGNGASGYFGRVSGDGNLIWENFVIGDLVTNEMYLVGETPDEQSVYLSVADNNSYKAYVRKYNIESGEELWEQDLNDVFSPGRIGTTFGYRGAAVTPDGGVFAAISYSILGGGQTGIEYGRLDADGNLMWWHDAPIGLFGMIANVALSDGSLFFVETNPELKIIKVNEDGTFDPSCDNGSLPDLDLENIKFFTSTVEVGQTYDIEVEVHNSGLGMASNYDVAVYIKEYDGFNTNTPEYFVNTFSYTDTEFGFFETTVEAQIPNLPGGLYRFKLVIDDAENVVESDENNNEIVSSIFTLENNGGGDLPDLTVSNLSNYSGAGETGEVIFFNFDLNNIGTQAALGSYSINISFETPNGLVLAGEVPTGDTPVGTLDVPAAITVPQLPNGDYNMIIHVDALDDIAELDENNNTLTTTFTIGSGGTACPDDLSGFTYLGEFEGSAYFISNDVARPTDAQVTAEANGGYLAVISSQEENDFIQQGADGLTYIGLNDFDTEGDLQWVNGESFTYNNINPCGFCNENSDDQDFVVIQPWDGGWSFSNFWNQRKYIVEIPCGVNVNMNLSNTLIVNPSDLNTEKADLLTVEKLYPNPSKDFVYIAVQSPVEQTIEMQLFNARGSLVRTLNLDLVEGENIPHIVISDLPAGMYSIYIPQAQRKNATQRFLKIRD